MGCWVQSCKPSLRGTPTPRSVNLASKTDLSHHGLATMHHLQSVCVCVCVHKADANCFSTVFSINTAYCLFP